MAPHAVTNGDTHQSDRNVTVLVTGFGPFQERFPVNPSYEITRSLPNLLPNKTAPGGKIRIITYDNPIRVCYKEVHDLVPVLHESLYGSVDLVLHIGMSSGRDFYTAELYAHRDGYSKNKDLDGETLPADHGLIHFPECPAMMTSSLDLDDVWRVWKSNLLKASASGASDFDPDCRLSEDAGHYLCDYIYYNSLAWFGRRNGRLDGGNVQDRPVLFLHVPAESDGDMLEKGRQVTIALIDAMVENWCSSRSNGVYEHIEQAAL